MENSPYYISSSTLTTLSPLSVYYITTKNTEDAEKISKVLLENKLIACCNIIGTNENPINSLFTWKGNVDNEKEVLMMLKSRTGLLPDIVKIVKENHPYEVPEVIALPIIGGNPDYIKWVFESTREPTQEKTC